MVQRPTNIGKFEFAIIAGLRAVQLTRGCTPRVSGSHKIAVMAQMEVAAHTVVRFPHAGLDAWPR
jgi:DNA-directed RNA polymerase subunit K/omega